MVQAVTIILGTKIVFAPIGLVLVATWWYDIFFRTRTICVPAAPVRGTFWTLAVIGCMVFAVIGSLILAMIGSLTGFLRTTVGLGGAVMVGFLWSIFVGVGGIVTGHLNYGLSTARKDYLHRKYDTVSD